MLKRSPLTRKTPMPRGKALTRASEPAKLTVKLPKCAACRNEFVRLRPKQKACSPECAQQIAQDTRLKGERRDDKAKRESLLTRADWLKRAQVAFNAYIRARDQAAGHPCICCGQPLDWGAVGVRGHSVDAGHYRSTGSAPHLRFVEANCHAQRVVCNRHGAGRAVDYRIGLVKRIGPGLVEQLEADQTPRRYSIPDLQELVTLYRAKLKALKSVASPSPNSGAQLGAYIA